MKIKENFGLIASLGAFVFSLVGIVIASDLDFIFSNIPIRIILLLLLIMGIYINPRTAEYTPAGFTPEYKTRSAFIIWAAALNLVVALMSIFSTVKPWLTEGQRSGQLFDFDTVLILNIVSLIISIYLLRSFEKKFYSATKIAYSKSRTLLYLAILIISLGLFGYFITTKINTL